jgi:long-chain acyl-CoA synthetase
MTARLTVITTSAPYGELGSMAQARIDAACECGQQKTGCRVALSIADPIEFLDTYLSRLRDGDIPVVLNPKIPTIEATSLARRMHCRHLLTGRGEQAEMQLDSRREPSYRHAFCSSGTSSRTGEPKVFTHELARSRQNARAHMKSLDFQPSDGSRILLPMPLTHSFGLIAGVMGSAAFDLDLFVAPVGLTAEGFFNAIETYGIDSIYLTPSQANMLINYLRRNQRRHIPPLKRVSIGSAVVYSNDLLNLMQFFADTAFYVTYGMTELGPRVSTFRAGSGRYPNSALAATPGLPPPLGEPLEGVSVAVRNNRLLINSPFKALDVECGIDDFFDSHDRAVEESDGMIRVLGRADDTIIRSGVNIYPEEVEARLNDINGLAACVLVGLPSKTYGQVPVLVCEIADRNSQALMKDSIHAALNGVLPESHLPSQIHFFDRLPRTALGKIQRKMIVDSILAEALP